LEVKQAQNEVREAFAGGSMGQLISGLLWLTSAALATWSSERSAILLLVFGGMFIFPLTQLGLRLVGKQGKLGEDNPLNGLGMQVAFVLPLSLPLVYAAALHNPLWFYPAFMILVGAHYLPFVFLYGMSLFAVLCGVLVAAGLMLGLYGPPIFALGGWTTGGVLLLFSLLSLKFNQRAD
jgi:Family of unknown function (DUF7010)